MQTKKDPLFGRVVIPGKDKDGEYIERLIGYVEYDQNFHCVYSAVRHTLNEVYNNLGKVGNTARVNNRRNPLLQDVLIVIETEPRISWKSEMCLESMCITGNRMPYNNWAKPSKLMGLDGEPDEIGRYKENVKNHYCLPPIGR